MSRILSVKVSNLLVNKDNPRFSASINQREAIKLMIEDQGDKIEKLAKDLLEAGFNPSDLPMVVPHESETGRYVVLEGNRRVVALKILLESALIPVEMKLLGTKIKKLSEEYDVPNEITCAIMDTPEEAYKWIELKHTGENAGVGTVTWDGIQTARFREQMGKPSAALQVLNFVKDKGTLDEETKSKIDSIAITNLKRLIDDRDVKDFLGIDFKDGKIQTSLPEVEVLKGLTRIIKDLAHKKINVSNIDSKDDRLLYINSFTSKETPDKTEVSPAEIAKVPGIPDGTTDPTITPMPITITPIPVTRIIPIRSSRSRTKLIPTNCTLRINVNRINDIYLELKKLDVNSFPNAAAVLLRVFIELSVDEFIERNEITGVNKDTSLVKKVQAVTDYFKVNGILNRDELKPINVTLSSPDQIFSTNTLNAFIHNYHIQPKSDDLKVGWDNLQLFVKKLWE